MIEAGAQFLLFGHNLMTKEEARKIHQTIRFYKMGTNEKPQPAWVRRPGLSWLLDASRYLFRPNDQRESIARLASHRVHCGLDGSSRRVRSSCVQRIRTTCNFLSDLTENARVSAQIFVVR